MVLLGTSWEETNIASLRTQVRAQLEAVTEIPHQRCVERFPSHAACREHPSITLVKAVSGAFYSLDLNSLVMDLSIFSWDVVSGTRGELELIDNSLHLVERLREVPMRARHWKQMIALNKSASFDADKVSSNSLQSLFTLRLSEHEPTILAIFQQAEGDFKTEVELLPWRSSALRRKFDAITYFSAIMSL